MPRYKPPVRQWTSQEAKAFFESKQTKEPERGSNMNKAVGIVGVIVVILLALWGIVWLFGSSNPYTPAGYAGYVTQGSIFGEAKYLAVQIGPKSYGRKWLAHVVNIPITTNTYQEFFEGTHAVLSKDDLMTQFDVHTVLRAKSDEASVRLLIEKFAPGSDKMDPVTAGYKGYLQAPLRNMARDEIQSLKALQIKDNINRIGGDLTGKMKDMCKDTPFEIVTVVVGNIQYPKQVADAVADKLAANQIKETKQIQIDQAEMDAQKRVKEAQGIADAMKIINAQLSWQYLQHEAIEAQKLMANSPNHTTIYIPSGPMGVPLVGTMDVGGRAAGAK